jgi:Histidyl-tRNA synthetase
MEGTEFAERLPPIFARINALISYLQGFEIKRKVYVNPLSSLNDKFFRGSILFQCVFDSKSRDVFAAGGRYDRLIQEFNPRVLSSRSQPHAVGFNLSWDKLSSSMFEYLKATSKAFLKHSETETGGFWRTRRVRHLSQIRDFSFADRNSVTCLLQVSTLLCCVLWASRPFKSCGPTILALS